MVRPVMFILWGISEIGCLANNYKITKLKSTIYSYRFRYVYREIYKHIEIFVCLGTICVILNSNWMCVYKETSSDNNL